MKRTMNCAGVEFELGAYVDGEMRGPDMLSVARHIESCGSCAREALELRDLGNALRMAAQSRPSPLDALAGLADGVVSRVRAEHAQSWTGKLMGGFDRSLWLLVGTGSVGATVLSLLLVFTMVQVGVKERDDSLAAWISVLSQPVGSDENPVFQDFDAQRQHLPSLRTSDFPAELTGADMAGAEAVVDSEGRISSFRMLTPHVNLDPAELENSLRGVRFEPGHSKQGNQSPLAMRVLWMMAHTNVSMRGKPTLE